jgi:hypothetical protein
MFTVQPHVRNSYFTARAARILQKFLKWLLLVIKTKRWHNVEVIRGFEERATVPPQHIIAPLLFRSSPNPATMTICTSYAYVCVLVALILGISIYVSDGRSVDMCHLHSAPETLDNG